MYLTPRKKSVILVSFLCIMVMFFPTSTAQAGQPVGTWTEASAEVREQHSPEVIQAYIDAYWRNVWIETYWRRVVEFTRAVERARYTLPACSGPGQRACQVAGIEVCNGRTLPTCGIVFRESRFNPTIHNSHSSAWGLYQFLRGTWYAYCREFPHGRATVAQQAECARRAWNGGRGSSHWRLTR